MDPLQLPSGFAQYKRTPLLWSHGSPIEHLDRLTNHLRDSNVQVWIKRDDCNSGLAFGGNKLRALEYILPDVLERGYNIVVTEGGTQSNSMRQAAAAAAKVGLEARLVQRPGSVNWKEPTSDAYQTLGNVQITKLCSPNYTEGSVTDVLSELSASGRKPYHIPAGGSGIALGGLGYARLAFEIIHQEKEQDVFFDTIILPSAGGTTSGAMLAGFKLALMENPSCQHSTRSRRIISVFVGSDAWSLEKPLKKAFHETMKLLRPNPSASEELFMNANNLEMEFSYNGGGYGVVDDGTIRAMKLAGTLEGFILDPVYTGKAFACMLDKIKTKDITSGSNILFLHTGGGPVLSAYSHLNLD